MAMKTIQKLTLLLAFSYCSFSLQANPISFIQNNLELAKQRAASEGKLILVDFWAHWCSPCTWMDEHTFSNKELGNYLNENYISVRIDIDNLEGYAYKEQYQIRYLPSILILNDQGQLIKKYEESFAPSKLLSLLKEHNKGGHNKQYYATASTNTYQPANPINSTVQDAPTYRPALSSDYSTIPTTQTTPTNEPTNTPTYQSSTSVVTEDYMVSSPANTSTSTTSTYTPYHRQNETTNTTDYATAAPTYSETASGTTVNTSYPTNSTNSTIDYGATGTYEFVVRPAPQNGFSVQVGAYYEYGNVLREVAEFQKKYMDVVYVHISKLHGANCYKVLLGHFGTRESANQQKAFLKEKGLDCFIKDLAEM